MTSFISYAQNFEDVALFRALGSIERGFYIDIGAFHPQQHSVTKAFYDRGWSGINVEPNPTRHDQIQDARPRDTTLRVAISSAPGTLQLTIFENDALSTTSAETIETHGSNHEVVNVVEVTAMTLESLWDEHVPAGTDVHFLKLDIEGSERDVIKHFDWKTYRPWIVVVESTKPETDIDISAEWEQSLLDGGFLFAHNDRLNRFYVAQEHEELASALALPPSLHDRILPAETAALRLRVHELTVADSNAAALRTRVEELTEVRAEAEAQIRELHTALAEQSQRITRAELSALEAQQLYRDVLESTSWRITRPLRAISRFARGRLRPPAPPTQL